jgi:hypothetical protein
MKLLGWLIPWWAYAAIAAVALVAAFSAGWRIESLRWTAHEAKALSEAQKRFEAQLAKQNKEATTYERDRDTARQQNDARQQSIRTIYRDRPVPSDCAAPPDVRGLLDNAVREANARASGQPGASVPAAPGTASGS